jgi:CUB/sushi domain-containing protein
MIQLGHLIHLGVHYSHPLAKGTASVVVISGEADAGSWQYHFGDRLLVSCKHGKFALKNIYLGNTYAIGVNYAGRHLKGSSAILVCQADQPPVCESQCDTVCLNGGFCNSNNRKCTCQPGYSGDRYQHGI